MFSIIIKLFISLVLIYFLFTKAYSSGGFEIISQIKSIDLLLAIIAHLFSLICLFVRWYLLLSSNLKFSLKNIIPSYYIGFFANNFLPTSFGGDFVRASYLYKSGLSINSLTTTIVIDRLFGLTATIFVMIVSFYLTRSLLSNLINMNITLVLLISFLTVIIIVLTNNNLITPILRAFNFNEQFINFLQNIKQAIKQIFKHNLSIIMSVILSFMSILSVAFCYFILSNSLNIDVPFAAILLAITLSIISASLPISIGGLGVREGTFIYILSLFGTQIEHSISLSLLYLLVLIVISLPGGLFFITTRFNK